MAEQGIDVTKKVIGEILGQAQLVRETFAELKAAFGDTLIPFSWPITTDIDEDLKEAIAMADDELEQLGVGALRKAAVEGNEAEGCFLSGQIAAMVNKEQPAAEIIREMFTEAEEVLKGAAKWVK